MQAITEWSKNLRVEVRGDDVAQHAGNAITRMLADATGLSEALSAAVSRPEVIHDRGAVLRDMAVAIADGTDCISDARVLRDQPRVFGPVASIPTMWRSLNEIDHAALARITVARDRIRERVWELIAARHGRIPPSRTCYGDLGETIVIRIDASLIDSHSDKERADGNFKGGYGFHPLLAFCDNTGELLAVIPRSGNAGSNTAADHIAIIDAAIAAIAAIPAKWRRNLLITVDGAGSSHAVVDRLTTLNEQPGWSVGLLGRVRPGRAGPHRDRRHTGAGVGGRAGRRGDRAAAAQHRRRPAQHLAGRDADHGAARANPDRRPVVTVRADQRLPVSGDRHRHRRRAGPAARGAPPRARPRRGIPPLRQGHRPGQWPSSSFAINTAWVSAAAIAIDLLCWTRLLLLDGPLAKAEPATLRYRLLHTAARLVNHSRMLILRIPETWPWAQQFADAFNRVLAIP